MNAVMLVRTMTKSQNHMTANKIEIIIFEDCVGLEKPAFHMPVNYEELTATKELFAFWT